MTLEEKVNITRGVESDNTCAGTTGTVPRLGWPGMCLHDAGNGVRATDLVSSFPSALHVGASWDKNLTYQRGWYMGKEFKAKGGKLPGDGGFVTERLMDTGSQCDSGAQCRSFGT